MSHHDILLTPRSFVVSRPTREGQDRLHFSSPLAHLLVTTRSSPLSFGRPSCLVGLCIQFAPHPHIIPPKKSQHKKAGLIGTFWDPFHSSLRAFGVCHNCSVLESGLRSQASEPGTSRGSVNSGSVEWLLSQQTASAAHSCRILSHCMHMRMNYDSSVCTHWMQS